ncbi:MAG: hypothetical protein JO159_07800 [Acidobacteria bacterium]|nr:hypothetical protein [Acidobacteriota bacterium]
MPERIRFLSHKGKQILLVDVTNCNPEEVSRISHLVPSYVSGEPPDSVLLLADFTGSKINKAALASIKEAAVYDRPHLKRSAWVGTEALPKVFYENIRSFSQRELPTFKTREEALEWLVSA